MCNQASSGMGQYGSSAGYRPQGMNTKAYQSSPMPQNNNPILQGARQYGQSAMGRMPTFPSRFGDTGSNVQPTGWNPNGGGPMVPPGGGADYREVGPDPAQVVSDPAWVFGKGVEPSVGQPTQSVASPPSAFGYGTKPYQPEQSVGSPPSAFGKAAPSFAPPEMNSGLHQYQPQPSFQSPQNSLVQRATNNMNLWANPMGYTQQQLGPSFNPAGSPKGGYFNGGQYVPNVGNPRNGLDDAYRWGQAPGQVNNGLFIR